MHPFTHFSKRLDPSGDGQCQFASVSDQLSTIGITVSPEQLRSNVVSFMANEPFMQSHVSGDWNEYLARMTLSHTYGDHLTLFAAAKLYRVQFVVMSSIGLSGTRIISAEATDELRSDRPILFLGHYAETGEIRSEHYVSLSWKGTSSDWTEFISSLKKKRERHKVQSSAGGSVTVAVQSVQSCTVALYSCRLCFCLLNV